MNNTSVFPGSSVRNVGPTIEMNSMTMKLILQQSDSYVSCTIKCRLCSSQVYEYTTKGDRPLLCKLWSCCLANDSGSSQGITVGVCCCAASGIPCGPAAFNNTPFWSGLVSGIVSNTLWWNRRSTSGHDTTPVRYLFRIYAHLHHDCQIKTFSHEN